jgi:hypothetical protein
VTASLSSAGDDGSPYDFYFRILGKPTPRKTGLTRLSIFLLGFFQFQNGLFHDLTTAVIAAFRTGAVREHRGAAFCADSHGRRSDFELFPRAITPLFGMPLFRICHTKKALIRITISPRYHFFSALATPLYLKRIQWKHTDPKAE